MTKKTVEKYSKCDECDKIKGVCRCAIQRFTIYLGAPDKSEIPDGLAADNFMYTPPAKEQEEKKENQKMILVNFLKEHIKDVMISDNDSTKVYVRIDSYDHVEFYDLMSKRFLYWAKEKSFKTHNKVFSEDAFSAAISLTYALSMRASNIKRVHTYLRVAQTPDAIFYDLCNSKNELVKITPGHVEIIPMTKDSPVFTYSNRLAPQVTPNLKNHDYALDTFVNMLNIVDEEKFLFKIHFISLFLENLPTPICDLFSEQGKGKSQITASIKMLVDPQSEKLIENINKMPIKEDNFHLECNAKYLLSWDNVSHISASQSDDICRMITGGATEKRMLYTNDELVVQYFRKKFTLNGIGVNITRGDYLDRSINYSLGIVTKNDRWTDEKYEEKLKSIIPNILGDVFVTLTKALKIHSKIKDSFKELPRMAGFGIWGEAISQAIGKEPEFFLSEYAKISTNTLVKAGENHPLVKYVEFVMHSVEAYNQPISKFYNSMREWAESEGYDLKSKYSNFPKSAQGIRTNLERVNSFIRELGYFVNISDPDNSRTSGKKRGVVYVTISHILANVDSSSLSACQPTKDNSVTGRQGDKDDNPTLVENIITPIVNYTSESSENNIQSSEDKSLLSHESEVNEVKIEKKDNHNTPSNYTCNDCNTSWMHTSMDLEEIQKQHSLKNEGHTIVEIPSLDLSEANHS